jgi:transposase
MIPAIASRIPLVRRTKASALSLEDPINHPTRLTVAPVGASHHDLVARTYGVLNCAALIASDVGLPDLAGDLVPAPAPGLRQRSTPQRTHHRHVADATGQPFPAADRKCCPLAFVLTAGQAADSPQFIPVLKKVRVRGPVGRPRTRPDAVAADKAYSSRGNRAHLRKRRIKAVIPEKKDQAANRKKKGSGGGRPVSHDTELCKEGHTVERAINRMKAWRGIATRYDKTPGSYLAGLHLRASMIWNKDLTRAPP